MTDIAIKSGNDGSAVPLEIDRDDFERVLGRDQVKLDFEPKQEVLLGDEAELKEKVFKALPKVIAAKVSEMVPKDFELSEILVDFSLSGKPFGVGISGGARVKFAKRK